MNTHLSTQRPGCRLGIELLKDRCPASTTLDLILAALWLTPGMPNEQRVMPQTFKQILSSVSRELPDKVEQVPPTPVSSQLGVRSVPAQVANEPIRRVDLSASTQPLATTPLHVAFRPTAVALPAVNPAPIAGSLSQPAKPSVGTLPIDTPPLDNRESDAKLPPFRDIQRLSGGVSVTLTSSTDKVVVNANRTSGSQWRKSGNEELTGLPLIRDFNLAPMRDISNWDGSGTLPPYNDLEDPLVADPELVAVTATAVGGQPVRPLDIEVIYSNADNGGGGLIRLWKDQTKATAINGQLPNFPTCTFYVEGYRPSKQENDVKLKVTYVAMVPGMPPQVATAEKTLTIVPFAVNMEVRPSNPATVTLLRDSEGRIVGLNSGEQFPQNGGPVAGVKPGATFVATVWTTGASGDPGFVQNVTTVAQAEPSVLLTSNVPYVHYLQAGSYPILDHVDGVGAPVPWYLSARDNDVPNGVGLLSQDTPFMGNPEFAGLISSYDLTFMARLHLMWKFPDDTIFTLSLVDWQIVFQASLINGVLTPSPAAVVSAAPFVRSGQDPGTVILPRYNDQADFTPYS